MIKLCCYSKLRLQRKKLHSNVPVLNGMSSINPSECETMISSTEIPNSLPQLNFYEYPFLIIEAVHTNLHDTYGLPWWLTIVTVAIAYRFCVLPLYIINLRTAVKRKFLHKTLTEIQRSIIQLAIQGRYEEMFKKIHLLKFYTRNNGIGYSREILLPLISSVFYVFELRTLFRMLADTHVETFKQGGVAWFVDLTVFDQYYFFPLLFLLSSVVMVLNRLSMSLPNSEPKKRIYFMATIPICFFFYIFGRYDIPVAASLCMSTSFASCALQSTVVRFSRKVRAFCSIPNPILIKKTE